MAGYHGYSKSNNAIEAEREGKMTATALAKHIGGGATAAGVAAVLVPCEWHHTSKHFNRTDYYDLDRSAETTAEENANGEDIGEFEIDFARDSLIELIREESRRLKAESKTGQVFSLQTVHWIDWGGTRNHPKPYPQTKTGCTVTVRGQMATIHVPGGPSNPAGLTFRKKIGANGFSFGPDEPAKEQGNV